MARAKRHYLPGYVWHITHRCHKKDSHYKWVESALQTDNGDKENQWTQSIAVGSKAFIEKMKEALGYRARGRKVICADDAYELREVITPFGNADNLDYENTFLWN